MGTRRGRRQAGGAPQHPPARRREADPGRGRAGARRRRRVLARAGVTLAAIQQHVATLPDALYPSDAAGARAPGGDVRSPSGRPTGLRSWGAASSATPAARPARCATASAARWTATARSGCRRRATPSATSSTTWCARCTSPAAASSARPAVWPAPWASRCTCSRRRRSSRCAGSSAEQGGEGGYALSTFRPDDKETFIR